MNLAVLMNDYVQSLTGLRHCCTRVTYGELMNVLNDETSSNVSKLLKMQNPKKPCVLWQEQEMWRVTEYKSW